jgi:TonB family protein
MNPILRHVLVLTAGTLLAVVSTTHAVERPEQPAPVKQHYSLGVKLLTPTGGVNFSAYLQQSITTIRHNWIASLPEAAKAGETGTVVVRLQVSNDGSLLDEKVDTSSGKESFDSASVAALRASAPFPHFPSDFHGPNIDLRITFFYNVTPQAPNPAPVKIESDPTTPK